MKLQRVSVSALIIGVVIAIVCAVGAGIAIYNEVNRSQTLGTNKASSIELDSGKYTLYQQNGTGDGLALGDTVIRPVGGAIINLQSAGQTPDTFKSGDRRYTGIARFEIDRSGTYIVNFDKAPPREVVVGPQIVSAVTGVTAWFVGFAFGSLLVLLGLLGVIIALIKRRRRGRNWQPSDYANPRQWSAQE